MRSGADGQRVKLRHRIEMNTARRGVTVHPSHPEPQPPRKRRLVTIVVERPRCPRCNGVRLHKYRSIRDQGDGSALSWVRCGANDCGYRFRVVFE